MIFIMQAPFQHLIDLDHLNLHGNLDSKIPLLKKSKFWGRGVIKQ